MTRPIVPDASIAVKWLVREPDSSAAVALLGTGRELCAPELIRIEVAAAITRLFRIGAVGEEDARARLVAAASILSDKRVRVLSDGPLLQHACDIAIRIRHNLQDCLYIACADEVGGDLITADNQLHRRASAQFSFVKLL